MLRVLLLAAVCFCAGCRARSDDIVVRYLQLAVALGERDPDALDYYYGPSDWVSDTRAHPPAPSEIKRRALELSTRVQRENPPQKDFLLRQLQAIAARADLLTGARSSFESEARALFDVDLPPDVNRADIRREIDRLLPGTENLPSVTRVSMSGSSFPESASQR